MLTAEGIVSAMFTKPALPLEHEPPEGPANVTSYSPPAHQREVDGLFSAAKAERASGKPSIFKPAPPRPQPSESLLDHRMAEELQVLRRRIEQIGDSLAADATVVHRHSFALQSFDLMNQVLTHLTGVLEAKDKEAAVERISLRDLKARLQRIPIDTISRS
jgi:hypothetical protein